MSLELQISDRAQDDVVRQYSWYAIHANEEIAERYLRAFYASASSLAAHPGLGQRQRFLDPELQYLRSFRLDDSFNVHLIFYRADDSKLSHGARDLPRRLLEPGD